MTDLLTGLLTFALLIGALLFMVRGARGVKGPARSWRDLDNYNLEGQMWAVALLTGMAIGEIAQPNVVLVLAHHPDDPAALGQQSPIAGGVRPTQQELS